MLSLVVNIYTYDDANRLTSVDGVAYTWDNNGNMLSDGQNTYTYDSANRLITVSGSSGTITYAYNGLGERLQQTVGGVTTTYLLDLEGGLSQVLSDGTNEYLYGSGRIAQVSAFDTQYFLGDVLGSVRQLADAVGVVSLARGYDPFGNAGWSAGAAQTPFGYTSEQTDANGLVYLRARYYAPSVGRFVSKDTRVGDDNQPLSLNRWNYVEGNPINYKDPTGQIKEGEETDANNIWSGLKSHGITIVKDWGSYIQTYIYNQISYELCGWQVGRWDINELKYIEKAANDVQIKLHGWDKLHTAVGNITVNKINIGWTAAAPPFGQDIIGDIVFLHNYEVNESGMKYDFAHEFAHVWDYRESNQLSLNLMKRLETWFCPDEYINLPIIPLSCWAPYANHTDENGIIRSPEPPPDTCRVPNNKNCTEYASTYGGAGPLIENPGWEDWATSFGYFVYENYRSDEVIGLKPIRRQYIEEQISNLP